MSFRLFFALLCALLPGAAGWGAPPPEPGEPAALATRVHEIFRAKCVDCHGAQLARPKGKFGYVLDLARVAKNRKYVVGGEPDASDLYDLVFHDEMPGEDADVPPLTKAEKETVRRWIEIGAPAELASAATSLDPLATAGDEPAKVDLPFWKQALRWIGKFHPASTHFPIALMMVALVAEGLAWFTGRASWHQTVRFLVVLAALGGIATGALGWLNAWFSSYNKTVGMLLWWHRWVGTGAALWAALCAVLVLLAPGEEGSKERQRFRGALFVGAVLVGVAGFLGSALIYGLEHYSWS